MMKVKMIRQLLLALTWEIDFCVCCVIRLCCAGDSYENVKENETTEALHERAKIIVDMELLCACTNDPACLR